MIDALLDLAYARHAPEEDPAKYVAVDRTIGRTLSGLVQVIEAMEPRMSEYPPLAGTFLDEKPANE